MGLGDESLLAEGDGDVVVGDPVVEDTAGSTVTWALATTSVVGPVSGRHPAPTE